MATPWISLPRLCGGGSKKSRKESPEEAEKRRYRRGEKFLTRDLTRRLLRALGRGDHPSVGCGLTPVVQGGGVQLRLSDGRAGMAGLATCGKQTCAVCAPKIAARRSPEVGQVFDWARGRGLSLVMVTLTVRHQKGDPLDDLWDSVAGGWAEVTSGSQWASECPEAFAERLADWRARGAAHDDWVPADGGDRPRAPNGWHKGKTPRRRVGEAEEFGVQGWVRATEVTHGSAGWHVHIHSVLLVDAKAKGWADEQLRQEMRELGESMHRRWTKGVEAAGFESWRDSGGLDVQVIEGPVTGLADYLTKSADTPEEVEGAFYAASRKMAKEATFGPLKQGRGKESRTPLQLLSDAVRGLGDLELNGVYTEEMELLEEFIDASHGRRMIAYSAGLRDAAKLAEEESDEEIAAEEVGTEDDALLNLSNWTWWRVQPLVAGLLDAAELDGRAGAEAWLSERGFGWLEPSPVGFARKPAPPAPPGGD